MEYNLKKLRDDFRKLGGKQKVHDGSYVIPLEPYINGIYGYSVAGIGNPMEHTIYLMKQNDEEYKKAMAKTMLASKKAKLQEKRDKTQAKLQAELESYLQCCPRYRKASRIKAVLENIEELKKTDIRLGDTISEENLAVLFNQYGETRSMRTRNGIEYLYELPTVKSRKVQELEEALDEAEDKYTAVGTHIIDRLPSVKKKKLMKYKDEIISISDELESRRMLVKKYRNATKVLGLIRSVQALDLVRGEFEISSHR